jgi:hypothetical protein
MGSGLRILAVSGVVWAAAAAAGESPDFRHGWDAYQRNDYTTAIRFLVMAAEEGDARAARALADIHERGLGTPRDSEQAQRWRRMAGELDGATPAGEETEAEFWRRRARESERREWQNREEIRRLESEKRKPPPRDVRRSQSFHWGYGVGPRYYDPFWGPGWGWGPGFGWGPSWGYPGSGIRFGYSQGWTW